MLFSQSPADPLGEATIGGTCAYVQTFVPYKGFTTSGSLDPHEQCYVLRKELCGIRLADFAKTGAILDFTHDTCETCSLVTCNNWPRVISNRRKLTWINFFCSSKSVMLARLLLREHFQILGSYFLPHTNTGFVLWYYQRGRGFSSWVPKLPRKCESRHWFACGADLRLRSVGVRSSDYKMFLEWVDLLTHGALQACPRAPL